MNIERGFPNPKHGNGDSWNSVARGMPIPHESGIRCTHDSWTTTMAEESGDTTSTPKGPIPLNNEWISTNELGTTINPEEPTPIGNGIVHKANDCKPVTPGNSFPHGIGRSKNSWTPVTPEKLINEKSDTNPVGVRENQSESDNWRDLIGMYTGLLKEVTPDQNKGVTSVPLYFKTNDPANWKCNHLASIVCSKSSNEAQNNVILLSNKPRGLQVQRNTSMRSTSSKDGASSSTVTDSFQFAPITPAKHNNHQHVQEIPNFAIQETNNDSPPSAISTTQKQQIVPEDKDKDEHNIDLSKTPNQKTPTRRRKHRPRVIKPQKPKKDPKTGTTTTSPGETRVKRKCVRKQGVNISETKGPIVVKRKYVRKKGIDKFEGQQKTTVDNSSVKSCKKKLNFDLDHVEQDKSHDIINKKHDINVNVNPQDTQQERRMMSLPVNVINVPIARTTRHVPIVSSFILDEKRGNKRQSSDMNSLLKRKYVRKKGIDKFEGQQKTTVDNSSVKSCKKKLSFDLDHVEQDKSHDIINKKHDINLNVNPQDIQQERRMMSLPVNVINVPIAKTTRHVPIVSSFILDEKRGNKRHSSDMNSLLKRKYVRKKGIDKFEGQQKTTVDNSSVKSCKKKLNFDLDHVEQDKIHDIINRKHDINLNVNPQDIQQERRMMSLPVINVPIAKTTRHVPIVSSFTLDEKRGNKRQSSDMNSLLLYQKLLLGVAHRAHDRNIIMENHKKRKIMQSQFQDNLRTQMNNGIYSGSVMQILHPFSQKVNPTIQPPMSTMQPYMIRSVPERLKVGWNQTPPVPTKEGIKYGDITYPASVYNQCIKKDEVSVEYVTYKLEQLHINGDKRKGVKENGLVVYRGSDAIVPFEPIKKRNQRPKVDLDPDTERVWRLLMGKEGSEGGEWVDEDKEKWWENERRVFRGRADSFIARMHLVQGDRRFSRWKGSVVDSVIGVFLTQNVSDHLSSSAFMLLAAKFPLKTNCKNGACEEVEEKKDIIKIEEKIKSEDSVESTVVQTVDEIRSSSGSNSEAEDLTTGHVENDAKKQNTNSTEENDSHEAGANMSSKEKKRMAEDERNRAMDWDSLRKEAVSNGEKKEENKDAARDSLDYEALRHAPVNEISEVIKERGMNNLLAERMKEFLNRVVRDHGKIDLEWLRDAPPDKAKEYLLSFRGLGLKSVECVRLLTLHHLAFPVDTNVGRIAVRLGWVPLQPLPESLQLHLLEMYPVLDSIQKYLWPRLCKLDQLTLYELHYQMITFGKVFCTKSKPNCNACPMRAECRHFASAFASARLALPDPEEKRIVNSDAPVTKDPIPPVVITPMPLPPSETDFNKSDKNCEPIIEEPTTPEPEPTELSLSDIEDQYYEDSDEIPSIKLNMEEFTTNLQNIIQDNKQLQDDMSKALVALKPNAAYIPTPKLKDVSRLRTEHQVYELPDSHRLLEGLEKREPDDPSPYLLAIWTPGETANSIQPPERECLAQESGKLCDKTTCFSCNNIKEANSQVVRGTILIPCRTAMRGSFPLNGTYFQVNEMFADHASSLNPIDVPRSWIWNLPRRTVYFGTSVSTIFRGLSTHGIQYCFWKGFVCVRGFDRETRAPRPLMARLHFSPSKLIKIKNEGK